MSSKLVLVTAISLFVSLSAGSTPAMGPSMTTELVRRQAQSTNYFSIHATQIPEDEYYMGVGRGVFRNGQTSNYWIQCTQQPYTVSRGYAGCGIDDLYTRCAGNVAEARDGTDITCRTSLGFACMTARIFDDLDATTYDSWIKCGLSGEMTDLVRTPTGSSTTLPDVAIVAATTSSSTVRVQSTGTPAPVPSSPVITAVPTEQSQSGLATSLVVSTPSSTPNRSSTITVSTLTLCLSAIASMLLI